MQIYSKSTTNATSPLFTKINTIPQISTSGGDVYYASRKLLIHLFVVFQPTAACHANSRILLLTMRTMKSGTSPKGRSEKSKQFGHTAFIHNISNINNTNGNLKHSIKSSN